MTSESDLDQPWPDVELCMPDYDQAEYAEQCEQWRDWVRQRPSRWRAAQLRRWTC